MFSSLQKRYKSTESTFRNYGTLLKWFLVDSFWRFKWLTFGILITGFFGISSQVAAIGQVLYYAKVLQRGTDIEIWHWTFKVRESLLFLVLDVFAVLFWLSFSALLIYWSRAWIVKIGVKYDAFCSQRIISLFGSKFHFDKIADSKDSISNETLLRSATVDPRFCNRIIRICGGGIISSITCLVALVPLFYLNPFCTAIILALLLISLLCLYKVNTSGAKHSVDFEKHARGGRIEKADILKQLSGTTIQSASGDSPLVESFQSGSIKKDLQSYWGRLIAIEYSTLVNNILLAVGMPLVFLYLGTQAIRKAGGWEGIAAYLVALRYFLVNLKQTSRMVTSVNRFYPQLRRYYLVMKALSFTEAKSVLPDSYKIMCSGNDCMNNTLPAIKLKKGDRLGLITTDSLSRYTLSKTIDTFFSAYPGLVENVLSSAWFAASQWGYVSAPLRKCMGLPPDYHFEEIRENLECMELWTTTSRHLNDANLDKTWTPKQWGKLGEDAKYALSLIAGMNSDSQWIFLDERGLRLLSKSAVHYILNKFSDRITVIIFDKDFSTAGNYREGNFAVMDDTRLQGIGPIQWVNDHRILIKAVIDKAIRNQDESHLFDVDSELDDMDFD